MTIIKYELSCTLCGQKNQLNQFHPKYK